MIHLFSHFVPARLVLLAGLEGLLLLLAAYAGIYLHIADAGAVHPGFADAMVLQVGLFAIGMMVLLASMGLYQTDLWPNKRSVALRVVASFALAFLLMEFVSRFIPWPSLGPLAMAGALGLTLVGSVALRTLIHESAKADAFKSRVLVLGAGARSMALEEHAHLSMHTELVGYVSLHGEQVYVPDSRLIGQATENALSSIVDKFAIDEIVIAARDRRGGRLPVAELLECRSRGVAVMEMPSFFEREYRQIFLESLNPSWMVLGQGFRSDPVSNFVKRAFDLGASLILLLVTWPMMLIAAICILFESGGGVLYRQERVGKDGHVFELLKFRSMKNDAESDGNPQWASANDTRITRVGRFIRKVRIDELPQVFNVIRGDMSFVGPRPERPFFVGQLVGQIPYYALRHSVRPGITGWAQVRYAYGATVNDAVEKLQYDLYYVKNHSLFLDIMILISTVEVVLWGKGAR